MSTHPGHRTEQKNQIYKTHDVWRMKWLLVNSCLITYELMDITNVVTYILLKHQLIMTKKDLMMN